MPLTRIKSNGITNGAVTSTQLASTITLSGNITGGNLIGPYANTTSNINIPTAGGNINLSAAGNANILIVTGTGANITGTANVTGNANVGNIGATTAVITTGNITTVNSGLVQNGTSNVTITSGGNISLFTAGNATAQFVVTSTGANIPGTANVVGNANVGNLGTAGQLIATGNITAGNLKLNGSSSGTATLQAPAAASTYVYTLPSNTTTLGYINLPQSGTAKSGSYTLATTDVGMFIQVTTGGSIIIPNSTFSAGDIVSIFNNTSAGITITCNTTNCYIGGTDANKTSVTLATRGVVTILFITSTLCVLSGNVS